MDDLMATKLLQVSLIQKDRDQQIITQLIHQLSCLPLAIVQAASYINETGISLESYLNLLQDQESVLVELLSQDFEDEWRYTEIQNPVAATWLISFQQIQRLNIVAADYLSFMSCIHPRNIPLSLLPASKSTIQQQKALGLLKAYSFITGEDHDQLIHLHRLVHLATRNWLRVEGRLTEWIQETAQRLSEVFPSGETENRVRWRKLMPHAQYLLRDSVFQIETQDGEDLIQNVAECLYVDGKYQEAEGLLRYILDQRKSRLPENDERVLWSMNSLALTFMCQGRWLEAKQLFVRVIRIYQMTFGPKHLGRLVAMTNLAQIILYQGQLVEAEQLGTHAMELLKTLLGPQHPLTLTSMNNVASMFVSQNRWVEAEQLFVQVVETSKAVCGPEDPETLTGISNLAIVLRTQQRFAEAEELLVQVIEKQKTIFGLMHPDTLDTMGSLTVVLASQEQWTKAERLGIEVFETSKIVHGPRHPSTLADMRTLAAILGSQGQWEEAKQLFVDVMENRKTVFGPEHPHTLTSMIDLSYTLKRLGQHSEALFLLKSCVQLCDRKFGPIHRYTITFTSLLKAWQAEGFTANLPPSWQALVRSNEYT
jgi:tetratricopeptide (TPR) repeat protein